MKSVRALIVDDSSVMRKIVERALRQAGVELAELREAGNGAEALAVLAQSGVDLILCDINMPIMDGLRLWCLRDPQTRTRTRAKDSRRGQGQR
jgi:two-component system, chemotaxis family, chemotaxis protein CheY